MESDLVYVVTGGFSDFLGRRIAQNLVGASREVIVIDDQAVPDTDLKDTAERVNLGIGSERLAQRLGGLEKRLNIIHCQTQGRAEKDLLRNGERRQLEQLAFLKTCQQLRVQKITACLNAELLFADPLELPVTESDKESPKTLAGVNQLVMESHLPLLGLPWTSIHASALYGPGQYDGIVPRIFSKLNLNEPLDIFQPEIATKDFIHVDDAAAGAIAAADTGLGIYNISSGKETRLIALAKLMRKICASESAVSENITREFFYQRYCFSPVKARRDLGWQAVVSLKGGLTGTAAWLRDNLIS